MTKTGTDPTTAPEDAEDILEPGEVIYRAQLIEEPDSDMLREGVSALKETEGLRLDRVAETVWKAMLRVAEQTIVGLPPEPFPMALALKIAEFWRIFSEQEGEEPSLEAYHRLVDRWTAAAAGERAALEKLGTAEAALLTLCGECEGLHLKIVEAEDAQIRAGITERQMNATLQSCRDELAIAQDRHQRVREQLVAAKIDAQRVREAQERVEHLEGANALLRETIGEERRQLGEALEQLEAARDHAERVRAEAALVESEAFGRAFVLSELGDHARSIRRRWLLPRTVRRLIGEVEIAALHLVDESMQEEPEAPEGQAFELCCCPHCEEREKPVRLESCPHCEVRINGKPIDCPFCSIDERIAANSDQAEGAAA